MSNTKTKKLLEKECLKQLSEKQIEEMDSILAKKSGFLKAVDADDKLRVHTTSELFSGLPYYKDK